MEKIEEAESFIRLYASEVGIESTEMEQRRSEIVRHLKQYGHYDHTSEELAFGARVAWRNHANCIGRLYWKSLVVRDCRNESHPDDVAGQLVAHMHEAHNGGKIRSVISIFPSVKPDGLPPYIENRQVAQYAGYVSESGGVIGDPLNVEFTRTAVSLGWERPKEPGEFDRLPLIIRDSRDRRILYDLPEDCIHEVKIRHPSNRGLAGLGLRWYTVPCVCDMILTIGGIDYPCAPFSGFYMGTEIASRNFLDSFRYDLIAKAAVAMKLDQNDPLWKDEVALELNRAVLHSFMESGVTIIDHHAASEQFMNFMQLEHSNSRMPSANWMWIVPPQASSTCPVFHIQMKDTHDTPNFYRSRAEDGSGLKPYRGLEERSTARIRIDRQRRRLREWWQKHYS